MSQILEIHRLTTGEVTSASEADELTTEAVPFYDEVKGRADELIADLISNLDPYDFQDLVVWKLSFATDQSRRVVEPILKLPARPLPIKRVSEVLIVILGTVQNMPDHCLTATPVAAQEISFVKSFQQRFGLIKPGSIRWRE